MQNAKLKKKKVPPPHNQDSTDLCNIPEAVTLRSPAEKTDGENDIFTYLLFLCVSTDNLETVGGEIGSIINTH